MTTREQRSAANLADEAHEAATELWTLHKRVARTTAAFNTTALTAAAASAASSIAELTGPTVASAFVCMGAVAALMRTETRYGRGRIESLIERWQRHEREAGELAAKAPPGSHALQAARDLEARMGETRLASIGLLKHPYGGGRLRGNAPPTGTTEGA